MIYQFCIRRRTRLLIYMGVSNPAQPSGFYTNALALAHMTEAAIDVREGILVVIR